MTCPLYTIQPVTVYVLWREDAQGREVVCEFLTLERAALIAEAMARGSGGLLAGDVKDCAIPRPEPLTDF